LLHLSTAPLTKIVFRNPPPSVANGGGGGGQPRESGWRSDNLPGRW